MGIAKIEISVFEMTLHKRQTEMHLDKQKLCRPKILTQSFFPLKFITICNEISFDLPVSTRQIVNFKIVKKTLIMDIFDRVIDFVRPLREYLIIPFNILYFVKVCY